MTIRVLDDTAAVARLAAIKFKCSVQEAAARLAEWESTQNTLLVPRSIELPPVSRDGAGGRQYVDRAREVRVRIAAELGLDTKAAERLTFTLQGKQAWYLGPRPNLDQAKTALAVQQTPEKYIELMLQRELIEDAAFDAEDVFVSGGFGPGVYLGSLGQVSKNRLHLAEAKFTVRAKFNQLVCDVVAQAYAKRKSAATEVSSTVRPIDTGDGFMVGVTRLVPKDYVKLDGRERPLVGVSLDRRKLRESRLYYLNVLHEFALRLFTKAGVPVEAETFQATHCVDDAFIPLEPLTYLKRPLHVINASGEELTAEAMRPLQRFQDYFPEGYHVAGNKKAHFQPISVVTEQTIPVGLSPEFNYLFLNGEGGDGGSVRFGRKGESPLKEGRASDAYSALARGDSVADPYTEAKYRWLLERDTVSVVTQGLDCSPTQLAAVRPDRGSDQDTTLREALKRCLVELSIKECLLGMKTLPMPGLPEELTPSVLTLIATRSIQIGGKAPKQLVAVVDAEINADGVSISRVRRSPWASDTSAAIRFLSEFGFLQQDGSGRIQDRQFWVIDRSSGQRLVVWSGKFVPQLLLNHEYPGIEAALAAQDDQLGTEGGRDGKRKFYSKDRQFNLLPYYMSIYRSNCAPRGERLGTRVPVQDRGEFVRVFVPPEGGINGPGDSLSRFRDVMLYERDGRLVEKQLLDQRLIHLYLHTMTNGVLVGGDNSKMSVLEKLARLALEN